MTIRIVGFLALVFSAVALVPYGAHLAALPNKIAMTQAQYLVAQSAYSGWSIFAAVLIPAMLINTAFAFVVRGERLAFAFAVIACVLMAATLVIFFTWTYPANVTTRNWVAAPANWADLRARWEYSHAVNAVLNFAAFCLIAAANVLPRR